MSLIKPLLELEGYFEVNFQAIGGTAFDLSNTVFFGIFDGLDCARELDEGVSNADEINTSHVGFIIYLV
jgi:hypothetical protein